MAFVMIIFSFGIAFAVFADTGAEADTVEDEPSKSLTEKAINEKIN